MGRSRRKTKINKKPCRRIDAAVTYIPDKDVLIRTVLIKQLSTPGDQLPTNKQEITIHGHPKVVHSDCKYLPRRGRTRRAPRKYGEIMRSAGLFYADPGPNNCHKADTALTAQTRGRRSMSAPKWSNYANALLSCNIHLLFV